MLVIVHSEKTTNFIAINSRSSRMVEIYFNFLFEKTFYTVTPMFKTKVIQLPLRITSFCFILISQRGISIVEGDDIE